MLSFSPRFAFPSFNPTQAPPQAAVDLWHQLSAADYKLCRIFADRFESRLIRSSHSQRVGWERDSHSVYGILLPDPLPFASSPGHSAENDWYIYYVWGETMFRRTHKEREALRMLILPNSAEDWAELLRQSIHQDVFDIQWTVRPQYINALGETETLSSGYEFALSGCAPPTAAIPIFQVSGTGATPEQAARDACRRWIGRRKRQ